MGIIHLKKDGKTYQLDDQMSVEEAKKAMDLPPNEVLINSQGKVIKGKLGDQVKDGEAMASYPDFRYW